MDWLTLTEGIYEQTPMMRSYLNDILLPPKLLSFPQQWLSLQLTNLLFQLREALQLSEQNQQGNHLSYAIAADAFIQQHLAEDFTTQEIARRVGLNECSLKRAFKDHFNMGLARRQNHLRIKQAMQLLLQTNQSINEIALECGYDLASTFRHNFFIETNLSAIQWRKKNKL
jgi:transcriptional regulator GlxA family with amidase domain